MTSAKNQTEDWRVLIVDDEEAARYGIRRALAGYGYEMQEAGSAEAARAAIESKRPDLILLDVNLPGMSGTEFLRQLAEAGEHPPVIMITAYGSERMAVEAIKTGAYDYLSKPFEVDELRLVVKNALETVRLRRENQTLRKRIELEGAGGGPLLGNSEAMRRVRSMIEKVAETDATVLVRGESGTGKELVARELHERSTHRRAGPFVAVNCAALPSELIESELFGHEKGAFTGAAARRRGKFEQADGGTLFLDEIGDMSANVQAKLLRALEERRVERLGGSDSIPVDVRIVSATHRQLEQEIERGGFRADLFYRLQVVTIEIPPLRERREDIPGLAEAFAQRGAERYNLPPRTLAPSALRKLVEYDWP
ncbi:MAG TPA: sigma-54 dependent transcriptional regulator, partial [Pyrinomonadaceae bacterium]|nr:sigma-54 dependent transcriptional regulator [Pyrinomonadaceae bacterium]